MRLTSQFFVSALVRQAEAAMGFAMVEQKGATEAGAIFVVHRMPSGSFDLYAPALQTSYDTASNRDDRSFEKRLSDADEQAVTAFLHSEKRFDPDIWVVEIEISKTGFEGLIQLADDK